MNAIDGLWCGVRMCILVDVCFEHKKEDVDNVFQSVIFYADSI